MEYSKRFSGGDSKEPKKAECYGASRCRGHPRTASTQTAGRGKFWGTGKSRLSARDVRK